MHYSTEKYIIKPRNVGPRNKRGSFLASAHTHTQTHTERNVLKAIITKSPKTTAEQKVDLTNCNNFTSPLRAKNNNFVQFYELVFTLRILSLFLKKHKMN